ncbi:fibronectin [Chania multitudinisentens RB-25]|uniref:Fibronectin n=1 Tax=Chania multitudinisentens RB-25 TaxID=1441930 RepID=W0LAZ6_9GAMM|nr:lytic polysaccharide monooxygenase [Chania multitudinisentens]AHG19437.1 fibronectin [Chania multitudinisentens RB-25]
MKNNSSSIISKRKNISITPFHGHVFSPASRAFFAWQEGRLNTGQLNQREAGKFFPAVNAGLADTFAPDDTRNVLPPPDGKIASANQGDGEFLDEPGTHWQKHDVLSGDILTMSWHYTAPHLTRRWNYFITQPNWNPNQPLSRAQFEDRPFFQVQLGEQPFWSNGQALTPPQPTIHDLVLPQRTGYHVLLAVWEVADTGNAFYQVVDLNFVGTGGGGGEQPQPPRGLRITEVNSHTISLAWEASVSNVSHYLIYRNGSFIAQSTGLNFTDSGLQADTTFEYSVRAVNHAGNESALSASVSARTLPENNYENPPTPPVNLHSMGETENSISLMWGPSTSSNGIMGYLIYRDDIEIARVQPSQLTFLDTGLQPNTGYYYFVIAQDNQGRISAQSNILHVKTRPQSGGGSTYPQWELYTFYPVGARVSYRGSNWLCIQAHTAWTYDWVPGGLDYQTLWKIIP